MALSIQQERPSQKIGSLLVEIQALSEGILIEILSLQLGIERLDPRGATTGLSLSVPPLWEDSTCLRANDLIPIGKRDNALVIAFADPLNPNHIEAARETFGKDIIIGIAAKNEIHAAIDRTNSQKPKAFENVIVEKVNQILRDAIAAGNTSDIHLEPQRNDLQVRFRQDGVLINYQTFPLEMAPAIVSRLKTLAKLDPAEKRRHQEGRLVFEDKGIDVDLRMFTYVSIYGETILLRLPKTRSHLLDIRQLGMGPRMLHSYLEKALDTPAGIVIITGPTSSGKTTTMYSSLQHLKHSYTSVITAEDPVECFIDGVTQCSINPRINLTYEDTLKQIIRQDADVIVIGDIRDTFSAETAVQAASTGQRVLGTIQTVHGINGLLKLLKDADALLTSQTNISILAQRLMRQICSHCAETQPLGTHQLNSLGYGAKDLHGVNFKVGRGCSECHFSGYEGRVAVFELLTFDNLVKDAAISRKDSSEVRRMSMEAGGVVSLLEDAIYKGAQGLTSFDEIMRQIPRLDAPRPIGEIRRLLGEIQ